MGQGDGSVVSGKNGWGDVLAGITTGNVTTNIATDSLGNITNDGTWEYSWKNGGQLAAMENDSERWDFSYDASGMRTQRSNGNTTYKYTYEGTTLTQMTVGSNTLIFAYGVNGHPMGVKYNGTSYYYVTNAFGDVLAILDDEGAEVVAYSYDAWGNILSTSGSMASTLGAYNPFRYRGYVYDQETKLYYLQSRYYNPDICRFISADSIGYLGADGTLLSYNLFAYCSNNPVMYYDPSGHSVVAITLSVLAVLGFTATAIGVATDNNVITAIGLTAVAIPAIVSGGMAISLLTPVGIAVGSATVFAGAGTAVFASAEYQQVFTGHNWILDAGMSEGLYNGLMLTTAGIATLGTAASCFAHSFSINSIQSLGRFGKYGKPGYPGMKFTTLSGKTRVLSFHTHSHVTGKTISQWHWQLQKWNPLANEVGGTIGQWFWWNLRRF